MMLSPERLAELEYGACQQEKRDRMNARIQVWSLLAGFVSAFGLVSAQPGAISYVVALYPLVAACLARYSAHSESVLEQVKAYLHKQEEKSNYSGYEHFNKMARRTGIGGHMIALRDAMLLTDLLAVAVVIARLVLDGWYWIAGPVVVVEVAVACLTCFWLRRRR